MNTNRAYAKTLKRMYLMENAGESIYNALCSKSSDKEVAAVYKRLSLNETETAGRIFDELNVIGVSVPMIRKAVLRSTLSTVFALLPHSVLERLLKKTLKKQMFRLWFKLFHQNNEGFWQAMLDHEGLQYDLLKL
jgi:predicted nucleotidyltransferase